MRDRLGMGWVAALAVLAATAWAEDLRRPYDSPRVERETLYEFTEKPTVVLRGEDRYEISFAVKGNCDVTVGIVDEKGVVVRHLASGVLGPNAPAPFQKNSLKQILVWNGKDDLGWYPKEPERLQARVMLGLKPVFDKRLGGTSPKNLPGRPLGIALGPDAAYVIVQSYNGFGHSTIRKFDRDGKYLRTLAPPPASLPESRLGGMSFVEFEPGKRALHGVDLAATTSIGGWYLSPLDGDFVASCQPLVVGDRLVFTNAGYVWGSPGSFLHYIYTDGSTDLPGLKGRVLSKAQVAHRNIRMAISPDGKTLYLSNLRIAGSYGQDGGPSTVLYSRSLDGEKAAEIFAGVPGKPGSDNQHLGDTQGIDTDAQGRVYVADAVNNRIQVFSPEKKHLKTIPMERPAFVSLHKKTGAIYVQHLARVEGRTVNRITKLASFEDPKEEFHTDGIEGLVALDSWSAKPRLWMGGGVRAITDRPEYHSIRIFEEDAGRLRLIHNFADEADKDPGRFMAWHGIGSLGNSKSVCDPVREKLYYSNSHRFDLATGAYEGSTRLPRPADDIAFDKKGYLHGHENPGSGTPNVWRSSPARAAVANKRKLPDGREVLDQAYPECPYDYGEEALGLSGVIRTKCQAGPHTFQMGLGVNMQGDLAVVSQIYYVPKMEDVGMDLAMAGPKSQTAAGRWCEEGFDLDRLLKETERRGEQVYSIRREPGIPLAGSTIWTFDASGEAKNQYPVVVGHLVNGVQLDEEGFTYFTTRHAKRTENKIFLEGRAGVFGEEKRTTAPLWVYGKGRPEKLKVLFKNAPVPLDLPPQRPYELGDHDAWIEGAEWLYAGASPIVQAGCICPQSRFHLDWYRRSYVPEAYRHSFGILDTNGNLILHVGRYGNFDSAPGGQDGCKPGDTDIGITCARYLGGTDNYLAFEDWGERMLVLRLTYQAEERVPIKAK